MRRGIAVLAALVIVGAGPATGVAHAEPAPVGAVSLLSSVNNGGYLFVKVAWASEDPAADGAEVCMVEGVVPSDDPRRCDLDIQVEAPTLHTGKLTLTDRRSYSFSVFSYQDTSPRTYGAPVSVTAHGSRVTLRSHCGLVVYGDSCRITGRLFDTKTDTAIAHRQVQLWARRQQPGFEWRRIDTATTDGDGAVESVVSPRANTYYQWRFIDGNRYLPAASSQTQVAVTYRVTARLTDRTAVPGQRVKLYGVVKPQTADLRANLLHVVPPCGGTERVDRTRVRRRLLPDGRTAFGYVFTISAPGSGSSTFKVSTANAAHGYRNGYSRTVTLTTTAAAATRAASRGGPTAPAC